MIALFSKLSLIPNFYYTSFIVNILYCEFIILGSKIDPPQSELLGTYLFIYYEHYLQAL